MNFLDTEMYKYITWVNAACPSTLSFSFSPNKRLIKLTD